MTTDIQADSGPEAVAETKARLVAKSVLMQAESWAGVEAYAKVRGLRVSQLARMWLMERLRDERITVAA